MFGYLFMPPGWSPKPKTDADPGRAFTTCKAIESRDSRIDRSRFVLPRKPALLTIYHVDLSVSLISLPEP